MHWWNVVKSSCLVRHRRCACMPLLSSITSSDWRNPSRPTWTGHLSLVSAVSQSGMNSMRHLWSSCSQNVASALRRTWMHCARYEWCLSARSRPLFLDSTFSVLPVRQHVSNRFAWSLLCLPFFAMFATSLAAQYSATNMIHVDLALLAAFLGCLCSVLEPHVSFVAWRSLLGRYAKSNHHTGFCSWKTRTSFFLS